jgi:hypothetical protein
MARFTHAAAKHKTFVLFTASPNINALSYDINIDKKTGKLMRTYPLHVYWIRYAEGKGKPSELSYIQRKFAYGVTSKPLGNDNMISELCHTKNFRLL